MLSKSVIVFFLKSMLKKKGPDLASVYFSSTFAPEQKQHTFNTASDKGQRGGG